MNGKSSNLFNFVSARLERELRLFWQTAAIGVPRA
jgi:hypothetical protein